MVRIPAYQIWGQFLRSPGTFFGPTKLLLVSSFAEVYMPCGRRSGLMVMCTRSRPERAVRIWALAGDIVLCSWARHSTLAVPLSTQEYKWVPVNCWGNLTNCGEVTCDGLGVEILLAASCYKNQDKLRQLRARWHQGFTLIRLKLLVRREPLFIYLEMWIKTSVIVRFEILLWLLGCKNYWNLPEMVSGLEMNILPMPLEHEKLFIANTQLNFKLLTLTSLSVLSVSLL